MRHSFQMKQTVDKQGERAFRVAREIEIKQKLPIFFRVGEGENVCGLVFAAALAIQSARAGASNKRKREVVCLSQYRVLYFIVLNFRCRLSSEIPNSEHL